MGARRASAEQTPTGRVEPRIDELAAGYGAAEEALLAILLGVLAGATEDRQVDAVEEALARVADILEALFTQGTQWAEEVLPEVYARGLERALEAVEAGTHSIDLDAHDRAADLFVDDLIDSLAAATHNISRDAKAVIREAARINIAAQRSSANGSIEHNVRSMASTLEARGVRFVDRAGRGWDLERYARTVLVTHCVAARNYATALSALEVGSPGVRIRDALSGDTDVPCEEADGQVWSAAYFLAHLYEHPLCTREGTPVPPGTPVELDRE